MAKGHQFIVIEGLDGSGKSTQIELLRSHFAGQGVQTQFIHFPRHNEGVFGKLIARFLRGEFGAVTDVHPQLVALLFAEDRKEFATTLRGWLNAGQVVLCDRYVLSNIAFQCAKLSDPTEKAALREWILDFEFVQNDIPRPDSSLFLDVPFTHTERALAARRAAVARDYLDGAEDIHEKDHDLQRRVRAEYETIVDTMLGITKIACTGADGQMRSIAEVHALVLGAIGG